MSTIRPKKDAQTLNGNPVSTADPSPGDALVWDGSEWAPAAGGGGAGVPLNFSQTKGAQITITAAEIKPATVVSATITTQGNPVQIIVSGDANPGVAGWGHLNIYRDAVAIGQVVQFESSGANENVPYSLQVIDEPAAGTWTYSLKVVSVTTNTQFGEAAGPIISVTELGAESGGGTGTIGGTIASAEIAFGTGVDTIGGSANLTWNGNTVLVESPVDANGVTVQDTALTVNTNIQSGAIDMTSGFDQAFVSGKDVLLRFRADTAGGLIATIATLDETSSVAPLDLQIGELLIGGASSSAGDVLTSNGSGVAPSWQASGGSSAAGGVNEIQYNDGLNAFAASSNLTFDSATNDFTVGSAALGHSIRIGPTGYVSNPIIESLHSMNINIGDFFGALGIQAANNDLVLIGGDDGGGESYLQTQNNVRLETKGRLLVQPATDSGTAALFKKADGTTLFEIDTATPQINAYTRFSSQGGGVGLDINPYSIEYVGGAGFLLDSDSGVNIGTTTSTGVSIGSATAAITVAGAFTLPTTDGASGEVLTTNGAGNVTWQAPAGGFAVGSVTTNDDAPTSALSLTPASNTAVVYKATIAAKKQGSNSGASYGLVGAFKESGGTLTQIGTTTSLWSFEDTAALDAQLVIAGSDVQVQVTGEATTYPGGVTYIDPVSPPTPSGTTWTVGTLGGEDFADIATALANVSVVNGDRLLLSAETFTVASTITVSKEVTIQGAGLSSTIVQTANTAGDPATVIDITTNNVTIRDLTVKQRKTTNTSVEVAISINPATPIGSTGHYLETVRVETMEFGVYIRSDGWQINNCQLAYVGANNTTRRLIGIYRSNGQGIIANTTYDSAEGGVITGATRVITVVSTVGTPSERFGGYFRITNVTPIVSSTVSQFFNCESFPTGGAPLEFVVDNCTSSESSAFIVFVVDRTNLLSGFNYIALTNNIISGNHGGSPIGTKGLFAVDGTAAGANSMGTTTFYVDGNTIGNTTFRTGWSTILNTGLGYTASQLAQAGFDGVYYTNPSLTISTATINSWDWTASVETVSAP